MSQKNTSTVYFSDILDIHQEENSFLFSPKFSRVVLGEELAISRSNTGQVHFVLRIKQTAGRPVVEISLVRH